MLLLSHDADWDDELWGAIVLVVSAIDELIKGKEKFPNEKGIVLTGKQ